MCVALRALLRRNPRTKNPCCAPLCPLQVFPALVQVHSELFPQDLFSSIDGLLVKYLTAAAGSLPQATEPTV